MGREWKEGQGDSGGKEGQSKERGKEINEKGSIMIGFWNVARLGNKDRKF